VAHLVDLLVDGGVFFNVGVARRQIGLRLVVIIITDKILHGILGEKQLELSEKLGGQGLVGGQDQRGFLDLGHHLGHGKGFTRPGDPQQDLVWQPLVDPGHQLLDGLRLIALGGKLRNQMEGVF